MLQSHVKSPPTALSRREVLAGSAGLVAALGLAPGSVRAAVAPHSFRHGRFEMTVVSDGYLASPSSFHAQDVPPAEREAFFKEMGVPLDQIRGETNLTLIRAGDDLILFDTGSGRNFQPTAGTINESLAGAGVDPDEITKVVFSHGHPDHIWGTVVDDGKLRFANAAYYSAAVEWDFWTGDQAFNSLPSEMHDLVREAQRHYAAVKDVVTMVKPGDDIISGIRVLDTAGHTPGHVSFEVDGDEGMIIVVDAIINPTIYFAHPEWKFGFDAIHEVAVVTRQRLLDRAATDKVKLLGYHWPYPGVGYTERRGSGYAFVAV